MVKNALLSIAALSFVLAPVAAQANTRSGSSTTAFVSGEGSSSHSEKSSAHHKTSVFLLIGGLALAGGGLAVALSNQSKSSGT